MSKDLSPAFLAEILRRIGFHIRKGIQISHNGNTVIQKQAHTVRTVSGGVEYFSLNSQLSKKFPAVCVYGEDLIFRISAFIR